MDLGTGYCAQHRGKPNCLLVANVGAALADHLTMRQAAIQYAESNSPRRCAGLQCLFSTGHRALITKRAFAAHEIDFGQSAGTWHDDVLWTGVDAVTAGGAVDNKGILTARTRRPNRRRCRRRQASEEVSSRDSHCPWPPSAAGGAEDHLQYPDQKTVTADQHDRQDRKKKHGDEDKDTTLPAFSQHVIIVVFAHYPIPVSSSTFGKPKFFPLCASVIIPHFAHNIC